MASIISVRRSSDQSSNVPSTIERANKCFLPDMMVLSIVLFVMFVSTAKINNYFHNSLDHNRLSWSKIIKKSSGCPKFYILLTKIDLKVSVYCIVIFNIADYQLFRITTYPRPSNSICIEDTNPLLPTSPVHRNPAYQYG